jgi:HAD superfamily hydrolase (TIGR01450 family)
VSLFFESFLDWWTGGAQKDFSAILFDIDGTLISGGRGPLAGAEAMIEWLRGHSFPFCLLTNDGNHSHEEKSGFLRKAGVIVSPDEIVSCGDAIAGYVDDNKMRGQTVFAMGDLGVPDYAELAGLRVTRDIEALDKCSSVIIGEGNSHDWRLNMQAVMNSFLRNPARPFIVPNPDSYWPAKKRGEIGVGAGGQARFILGILKEAGVSVEPVYLGKPYSPVFHCALARLRLRFGIPAETPGKRILMLGDSLASDILGAKNAGFASGLMLTGITSLETALAAADDRSPDFVFHRFDGE